MKWGWDRQWARKVKGKVHFHCLKAHSGILTVKGEQVKCNSWLFPSGCDWTFWSTPRHPRDTSLVVSRKKSWASLTIYVIYVLFTCRYQVYVEIMAVLTHLQRNEELPAPSSGKLSTLFFPKKKPSGFAVVGCAKQQWVPPAPPPPTNFKDFCTIVLFLLWIVCWLWFLFWVGGGRSAIQTFYVHIFIVYFRRYFKLKGVNSADKVKCIFFRGKCSR